MRIYKTRTDPKYLERLDLALTLKGPDGLEATVLDWQEPHSQASGETETCKNIICIDYVGFSASTLFDRAKVRTNQCYFDHLDRLAQAAEALNARSIAVNIRVLLLYPYSAAGLARIQAEISTRRAAINDPEHSRSGAFLEQVTRYNMSKSESFQAQGNTIEVYDDWFTNTIGENHPIRNEPNRLELRLSTVNPLFCGLRINRLFFYDVYGYGKSDRFAKICPTDRIPLVEVAFRDQDAADSYCYLFDHFRYLWECDATLDYEDAVARTNQGTDILAPDKISFLTKAHRLFPESGAESDNSPRRFAYNVQAKRIFDRHCPPLRPTDASEVAFIACSWKQRSTGANSPNSDATTLQGLIGEHFGSENEVFGGVARLGTRLFVGTAGMDFAPTLYQALSDSTMGIVVLSPDIDISDERDGAGPYICSPNVYHELGYLMANNSRKRMFLFKERRVGLPANVAHLVRIDYDEGKIEKEFVHLIDALWELHILDTKEARRMAEICFVQLEAKARSVESQIGMSDVENAREFVSQSFGRSGATPKDSEKLEPEDPTST